MTPLPSPLTKATFEKMAGSWLSVFNLGESGSVINFPKREQLYRINQLLKDKSLIKRNLKDYSNFQIIPIDIDTLAFEDSQDFDLYLGKIISRKAKKIGLIILSSDKLTYEKSSLLPYLVTLPFNRPNVSLLFLFGINITSSDWLKKLASYTIPYQNVIIHQFYEEKDQSQFIFYLEKLYQVKIPSEIKNKIQVNCGGNLWFIKQAVRYFVKTKDEEKLFNHEEMLMRLKIVTSEFSSLENSVLEKIIKKINNFEDKEKPVLDYLISTRLIKKTNKKYFITIPIIENYLKNQLISQTQINVNKKGQVITNNIVMESCFSKKEKSLIKYFINNQNKIIPRSEIAQIIWGSNYLENYTDWALDQLIKRLRTKLENFGLPKDLIKTIKNQGYKFQN